MRLVAVALCACVAVTAGATLASAPALAATVALPPQGLYDECAPAQELHGCLDHLDLMGQAGFKLVLDYTQWSGTPAQELAFAQEASADGMKVIWPLSDAVWRDGGNALAQYPALARSCGCHDTYGLLSYLIGLVKGLPGTWGYYIGDEVASSELPAVATLASEIRTLDPDHPLLYVGVGDSPQGINDNVAPFGGIADVLGADVYPYGVESPSVTSQVAGEVQTITGAMGTQPALVLQAFDWSQYPGADPGAAPGFPTAADMRTQRDLALSAGPVSMLLWYSFYDIARSPDPWSHWSDLVNAAFGSRPVGPSARVDLTAGLGEFPSAGAPTAGTPEPSTSTVPSVAAAPTKHRSTHARRHRRQHKLTPRAHPARARRH